MKVIYIDRSSENEYDHKKYCVYDFLIRLTFHILNLNAQNMFIINIFIYIKYCDFLFFQLFFVIQTPDIYFLLLLRTCLLI